MKQSQNISLKQNPTSVEFFRIISLNKDALLSELNIQNYQIIDNFSYTKESLYQKLYRQLRLINLSKKQFYIGKLIISALDEKGFILKGELDFLTKTYSLGDVNYMQNIISFFDPVGCGLDEKKSIIAQIKDLDNKKEFLIKIIEENYNLVKKYKFKRLSNLYKVDIDFLKKEFEIFKKISFSPGFIKENQYVKPDIFLDNRLNIKTVFDDIKLPCDRKFIPFCMFLQNYYKVIKYIINYQSDFFLSKNRILKKLSLKDIQDQTQLSISCVSRIIKDKYLFFENEIYPMKYFLQRGLRAFGKGEKEYSKDYILKIISDLIYKNNNLKDNDIMIILKNRGVKISRRTVSKYRQKLNLQNYYNRVY